MNLEMNIGPDLGLVLKSSSSSFASGPNHGIAMCHVDEMHTVTVSPPLCPLSLCLSVSTPDYLPEC